MKEQVESLLRQFGGRARYKVLVQGRVPESWEDRLAGLNVVRVEWKDGTPFTELVGEIRDQSELNGIFESLYCLQLTIIEVERL